MGKVLVVEDDKDIRRSVRMLLESEGYTVAVAGNGAEALAVLKSSPVMPAVIVLDLMMPVMDGFQFRIEQAKVPVYAKIPVVIMTADGHIDDKKVRANAAGALKKPADIADILEVVAKFCKG